MEQFAKIMLIWYEFGMNLMDRVGRRIKNVGTGQNAYQNQNSRHPDRWD